jgi:hypothetical protein
MPITLDGTNGITTPMYNGSITANAVTPSVNMKNRIINGAMVIDQRNAGASVTPTSDSTYTLDRWKARLTQSSKYSVQQNAGSVTPPAGFTNYLGVTSLSAYSVSASDFFVIQQVIEGFNVADLGFGTANAKTITISFWVRSSLTGTFGGSVYNDGGSRNYPFTYTISSANTWEQKSITIAGDTSGTWATTSGAGLQLQIGLGVGSTYSGTAGAWSATNYLSATGATSVVGTNGATFYITGVQLEVGSTATSFDYRPFGTELMLCQRYFWRQTYTSDAPFSIAVASSSTGMRGCIQFPVPMRTNPTWSVGTIGQLIGQSNSTNYTASAYSILGSSTNGVYFSLTSSGMTGGMALSLTQNADINSQWSAEL